METVIHLDTHVAVWLYIGDRARLQAVRKTLERSELAVSPIVLLELQYLFEAGRVTQPSETVIDDLVTRLGLRISGAPFPLIVRHSLAQTWTRDPFDRLIVGAAIADGCRLLTSDAEIRKHFKQAFWA